VFLFPLITVEQLWAEKYAALHEAALAEEAERRAEDFIAVPRTVCGLELRVITPRDLLHLNLAGSPFVAGGEIDATHIAQFLWQMLDRQPRSWWGERKFFRHCAGLNYTESVAEIRKFIDRAFADSPRGGGGGGDDARPIGTSFVAPLIVRIATGIPSLTPDAIMDTPIPQLFQYRKILSAEAAARNGGKFRDASPADGLLSQCLDEANRLNAAPT
jgi:hypothetical protein